MEDRCEANAIGMSIEAPDRREKGGEKEVKVSDSGDAIGAKKDREDKFHRHENSGAERHRRGLNARCENGCAVHSVRRTGTTAGATYLLSLFQHVSSIISAVQNLTR